MSAKATYHIICDGAFRNSESEIKPTKQKHLLNHLNQSINEIIEYINEESYAIESITAIEVINSSVKYEIVFAWPKVPYITQLEDLVDKLSGQFSDGWGEGYEQFPFYGEEGTGKELYYSPWIPKHSPYKLVKVTK